MLGEGGGSSTRAVGARITYRPDIARGGSCHSLKLVVARPGVGAGHHAPVTSIPVLDQRLDDARATGCSVIHPRRPDIVGRYHCDASQVVQPLEAVAVGYCTPRAPVPVSDQ